jgi:Ca2+-binding RTX toxin-like protein
MTSIFQRTSIFSNAADADSGLRDDDHARLFAQPALQTLPTPYLNQAPTGSVVIVGTQSMGNMLLANTSGIADADGLGTFHYQWQTDSDVNFGWTDVGTDSPIYNLKAIDSDLNARVIVSYTDGHGTAEQVVSGPTDFIGENDSDVNGSLGIIGTLVEGQTITADTSKLSDADGLGTFTYNWSIQGVGNVAGPTLTLIPFYSTHPVTLSVFYLDGLGNFQSVFADLGPVTNINQAPVVTGPLLFGASIVGTRMEANTGNITDGDGFPIPLHFQWQRDSGGGFVTIAGTDDFAYTVTNADIGAHLRVLIDYLDRGGTNEHLVSESSQVIVASNTPHTGAVTLDGTTVSGQTLTANTSQLADIDGLGTFHYVWTRGGFTQVGSDDVPTYQLTDADVGQHVRVTVTYTDQHGTLETAFVELENNVTAASGPVVGDPIRIHAGYTEQASATVINGALTVSDGQSATLSSATVAITAGFVAGDTLAVAAQNGITGSYDAGTHILTLSGTASVANYQTALHTVTFFSASDNPTNYGANPTRTIAFQIDDGQPSNHASPVATTPLFVVGVNDAPTVKADTFTTTAAAVVTGNVFADNGAGADSDPDNVLVVTAAGGGSVGHPVFSPAGQTLIVNADGSFSFDSGHAYDSRPGPGSGAANIQTAFHFTYQIAGGGALVTINVTGVDSDDTLTGTSGNDTFNGGIGNNTLVFTGNHGDYAISTSGATTTFVDQRAGSPDGTDTAQNIQHYQFADGTFTPDLTEFTKPLTDSADSAPWSSQLLRYDAQGSLISQVVFNDNGSRDITTFNNGWLWASEHYDDLGRIVTKSGTQGDGTHFLVLYDAADQYSWANAQINYDANWNVTGVFGNRDSGNAPVTMKDIAAALDTAQWSAAPADADHGAAVANSLFGGANRDVLFGFAGADTLNGMGGNDYLDGGKGNDMLTGGAGADRFVFVTGDGNDTITDFTHGSDIIDLHGYGVTDFGALQTLMYQDGANLLIALDAQNHVTLNGVTIAQLSAGDFVFS